MKTEELIGLDYTSPPTSRSRPWLTPYWLPVIQISLTGSVWTTIAVSVERYFTVCLSKRYNTVQHLFYTLPILAFSFVFNIPGCD